MRKLPALHPAAALSLLPIAAYAVVIHIWSRNIPFNDDILDILQFFLQLGDADTLSEQFSAFVAPHTDHRTTASRLIYYLVVQLQGEINFITLTYVANASLLIMLFLFSAQLRVPERGGVLLLAIALMLFQPRAFGPMFCVMCGFAFFYVNVYALASLTLLARPAPLQFVLALACAVLANFTLASGQLLWMIGFAWLLYLRWHRDSLSLSYPLIWVAVGLCTVIFYRYGWETINTPSALIALFKEHPLFAFRFGLAVVGSAFAFGQPLIAESCGIILLLALCWLTYRRAGSGLSPLHAFAWFVLAQCVAITLGRAPYAVHTDNPEFFAVVPRYSFTSLCLVISIAMIALPGEAVSRKFWSRAVAASAAVFATASYLFYLPEIQAHWEHRLSFYNKGQYRLLGMPMKASNSIVHRAVESGLYFPPEPPLKAGLCR